MLFKTSCPMCSCQGVRPARGRVVGKDRGFMLCPKCNSRFFDLSPEETDEKLIEKWNTSDWCLNDVAQEVRRLEETIDDLNNTLGEIENDKCSLVEENVSLKKTIDSVACHFDAVAKSLPTFARMEKEIERIKGKHEKITKILGKK